MRKIYVSDIGNDKNNGLTGKQGSRSQRDWRFMKRIILICVLIVGIPLVAYAMGLPNKYIEGLFLLMPSPFTSSRKHSIRRIETRSSRS